MTRRLVFPVVLWVACGASVAHAEMFRCEGPGGGTIYTSDRSKCPRAEPHQSSGRIQRSIGAGEARTRPERPAPSSPARRAAIDEEAEAQVWRAKRGKAEAELRRARQRLETAHEVAGWCNRGHEVWATDRDGLRRGVDCNEVKRDEQKLRTLTEGIENYLAEGLEEECRRAGCLPGWIR
jgi:hypothetical protein